MYEVEIAAPDGSRGHLHARTEAVAADAEGDLAVPISYGGYGGNGHVKGGGIFVLDQNGKQVQFIDTGRFLPDAACFGPDHSIWMIGTQFTPIREGDAIDHVLRADYDLVRRYSPDGKKMNSFLPRSLFPPGLTPGEAGWMRASNDRIGIMTYPGTVANYPEWVELDSEGDIMGRWKVGSLLSSDRITGVQHALEGFAFTEDGRLFAHVFSCRAPQACSDRLELFDREDSTWKRVENNPIDRFHSLIGSDGDDVVLWDRTPRGRDTHLVWIEPGQLASGLAEK